MQELLSRFSPKRLHIQFFKYKYIHRQNRALQLLIEPHTIKIEL